MYSAAALNPVPVPGGFIQGLRPMLLSACSPRSQVRLHGRERMQKHASLHLALPLGSQAGARTHMEVSGLETKGGASDCQLGVFSGAGQIRTPGL